MLSIHLLTPNPLPILFSPPLASAAPCARRSTDPRMGEPSEDVSFILDSLAQSNPLPPQLTGQTRSRAFGVGDTRWEYGGRIGGRYHYAPGKAVQIVRGTSGVSAVCVIASGEGIMGMSAHRGMPCSANAIMFGSRITFHLARSRFGEVRHLQTDPRAKIRWNSREEPLGFAGSFGRKAIGVQVSMLEAQNACTLGCIFEARSEGPRQVRRVPWSQKFTFAETCPVGTRDRGNRCNSE